MLEFLIILEEFGVITALVRLLAAAAMGGFIGSERGRHGRPAGLRTHILICIGAAMTSLTSVYLSEYLGIDGDIARLPAQVISGIGFLGAGTIMIRNSSIITGLTTAAGMWATAAIGVAVGYGFYAGAIIGTLICIFSVTVLSRLERKRKNVLNIYIELSEIGDTEAAVEDINALGDDLISYDILPPKSGKQENIGISLMLHGEKNFLPLKNAISEHCSVEMMLSDISS